MSLLVLDNIKKHFGAQEVLRGATFSIDPGQKIGIVGRNGGGKTTLFRMIAREEQPDWGEVRVRKNARLGVVPQRPKFDPGQTAREYVTSGLDDLFETIGRYEACALGMGEAEGETLERLMAEHDRLGTRIEELGGWDTERKVETVLSGIGLPQTHWDREAAVLSGGEKNRVALARELIGGHDLLLLDEPTNHLDSESIAWLETHLSEYEGTVILITHDRYFLDNVVGWMLEVERGLARPYKGNYTAYLEQKSKMLDLKRKNDAARAKVLDREKEWLSRTPAARTKQSKARLKRYQDLAQEARADEMAQSLELRIPPGPRLGDKVLEVEHVAKTYGDRTLFEDLSFSVPPQAKLGVIGANGMGKSTLMKIIMGTETSDAGGVDIGSTVQMRFLDQSRTVLDDEQSVFENITDGNEQLPFGTAVIDSRAYLARFNFRGEDQQRKVGECSGGQRNRVMLAKMLREPANLIIMDEPTNDLDLDTLRVLEEAIQHYPGSMIIVTHDRYFLNRVATHILSFEGPGEDGVGVVHFHHGDYESFKDWKRSRGEDLDAAKGPHRRFARD